MGLLQVTGTLDPNQFWPSGSSDGDTAHVHVESVTFNGKATHAFHGAHVRSRIQKGVIDQHGRITVRLQGIDAPELHYMPPVTKPKAKQPTAAFRQHYGRLAAERPGEFLKTLGAGPPACRVVTRVEKPNEVFNTYCSSNASTTASACGPTSRITCGPPMKVWGYLYTSSARWRLQCA
jgi:hypothetical protein